MTDDWKPGDLALCVNSDPVSGTVWVFGCDLKRGGIYTVSRVWQTTRGAVLTVNEVECTTISGGFGVYRFRKINPHTPDAEDRETIELLNRKPVEVVQ